MADAYIGEIRMVGFQYAPEYWSNADGQLLAVSQYTTLYSLYGVLYGGDGRTNFKLPDFRGRVPIHVGRGPGLPDFQMGWAGGVPSVVLAANQAPVHTHPAVVHARAGSATQVTPENHYWGEEGRTNLYCTDRSVNMAPDAVEVGENTGGGQAHENMQPYLTIRFCVCMDGQYPPRP